MAPNGLHTALCALLGAAWAFAIIELGLSAYVVSLFDSIGQLGGELGLQGLYGLNISKPPITSFSVFASVWTILVSVGALVAAWFFPRRASVSRNLNKTLALTLIALYFITMACWLGTFADYAVHTGGAFYMSADLNAILAFGVLLWSARCHTLLSVLTAFRLIFLALLTLTVLAVTGVLHSDWPGYSSFREHSGAHPEVEPEIKPDAEPRTLGDAPAPQITEAPTYSGAGDFQRETQPEPEPEARRDAPRFVEAPAYSEVAELPDSSQMKHEETPVSPP